MVSLGVRSKEVRYSGSCNDCTYTHSISETGFVYPFHFDGFHAGTGDTWGGLLRKSLIYKYNIEVE